MTHRKRPGLVLAVVLLFSGFGVACESPPSNVKDNIGSSFEKSKEQMIASNDPAKEKGISGTTATGVSENYHQRQEADEQRRRLEATSSAGQIRF